MRDGRVLPFAGLFTATRTEPVSPLAKAAGCEMIEMPMGRQILTDETKETSIPGVFACGDVARAPHSVSLAVGDVASYAARVARHVPGLHDLHRMAGLLLAEHVPENGRVLVLGAGGGLELRAFAQAHPGWRFDGVDPSPGMIAQARDILGEDGDRATFHQGYIDDAPDGPFDGATCLLTLHFLPQEERLRTLHELHRRLRLGAPFVTAHHSFPLEGGQQDLWLRRNAAWLISGGMPKA